MFERLVSLIAMRVADAVIPRVERALQDALADASQLLDEREASEAARVMAGRSNAKQRRARSNGESDSTLALREAIKRQRGY